MQYLWKIKGRERYIFLGQGCDRVREIGFGWVAWTGGYPVNPYILPILILTRDLAHNARDFEMRLTISHHCYIFWL